MTPEERKALREKHQQVWLTGNVTVCNFCSQYKDEIDSHCDHEPVRYPCDVIKALDWADEVLEELKGLTAHFEGIWY